MSPLEPRYEARPSLCLGLHHCRFKMATINQESVVKRTSSTNFVTVTSSCSSGTPSFVSSFSSSSSFRFLGGVNCLFNRGPSAKRKICCLGEFHLRELIFDVSTLIFLRSDKHTNILSTIWSTKAPNPQQHVTPVTRLRKIV